MSKYEKNHVWLDDIGIIHMGPRETAAKNMHCGSTMLMKEEMKKLAEILDFLEEEKLSNMMFWEWKKFEGISNYTGEEYKYWRLCPRIMFFLEEDAVYFKMTYGAGKG